MSTNPNMTFGLALDLSTISVLAHGIAEHIVSAGGVGYTDTTASPWMTAEQAGAYIGVSRQRIADLTYSRKLIPDGYDGRSPRYEREQLDAYLRGTSRR
jgi:hypothetical protein